jgi:hypothetical protein
MRMHTYVVQHEAKAHNGSSMLTDAKTSRWRGVRVSNHGQAAAINGSANGFCAVDPETCVEASVLCKVGHRCVMPSSSFVGLDCNFEFRAVSKHCLMSASDSRNKNVSTPHTAEEHLKVSWKL